MITTTLVAILGLLLVLVLWQLFKKSQPAAMPPQRTESLADLKVGQARAGDAISLAGAGDDLSDLDFTVDRCEHFEAGARRWLELGGSYRERRIRLEVSEEAGAPVDAFLDPRPLTIDELGLTEDDLAQIDERQNTADNFEFEDKPWFYRFSKEVRGPRNCYRWQFEEEGGKRSLAVQKAEGEPFAAWVAVRIHPGNITVYRGA